MSKEGNPRVSQWDVRQVPFQPAFGETAKRTKRGIAIINSEGVLGKSDSKKPPKISVEVIIRKKFGVSPLKLFPDLYSQELNPSEISGITGVSETSVNYWLRKAGTEMRTRRQSLRLIWNSSEKRSQILAKIHTPEANKRRKASLQRFYSKHPDRVIDRKLQIIKVAEKENARRREEKINLMKQALGARSKKELTIKLQSLYDSLGTFTGLAAWFKQKDFPVAANTVKKILKSLGIEIKQPKSKRTPRLKDEDMQSVLEAKQKASGFSALTLEEANVISLRYLGKESLRTIAKGIGISHETVRKIERSALTKLREQAT